MHRRTVEPLMPTETCPKCKQYDALQAMWERQARTIAELQSHLRIERHHRAIAEKKAGIQPI